ncbi:hypothetical protein ACJW30_05G118300 [Castanea mollissima]
MTSPISFISILVIPLLVTSHFYQVKADLALLDSICQQAQDYDFCMSTFRGDERAAVADRDGLALISIAINSGTVQDTIDQISDILKTLTDPLDKYRIQNCQTDFSDALVTLKAAYSASSARSYREVIGFITDVARKAVDCDAEYRESPPVRESPISDNTLKVTKLTDITFTVINTIIST